MKLDAILFDLDGTLTDSTRLFYAGIEHGMKRMGMSLEREHFLRWHSNGDPWNDLLKLHSGDDTQGKLLKEFSFEEFGKLVTTDLQWMPGAEELVTALHDRGMPMAIITNNYDPFIDIMDKSVPLKTYFPVIITATLMEDRKKPDPYGLLLAAEKLGALPDRCMYVGDQPFDILAANAAAMHECLFIGPHTTPDAELMAKHTVRALPEILRLID